MTDLPISLARNWHTRQNRYVHNLLRELSDTLDVDVIPHVLDWSTLWSDLNRIAEQKTDMVISEVGSTWLSNLVNQNALYDFSETDIEQLGGFRKYSGWNIGAGSQWRAVYAIPWMSDSQVLYYWRDMIEDADVDPTIEFASVNSFGNALAKISQEVLRFPWAVSTSRASSNVHQLASWIWGSDAKIIDESGSHIHILDIKAIQAITQYFSLYRYIPEFSQTSPVQMTTYFANRQAALMMGGTRTYYDLKRILPDHHMQRIGVALPPGVPFVGTQHLVMWDHADASAKADGIKFLQCFLNPDIHQQMSDIIGLMPTNEDLLSQPIYQQDAFLWTISTAIQIGKSYPALPQWTAVEHHLMDTIDAIWEDILVHKATDIENVVFKHLIRFGQNVRPELG